MKVSIAIDDLNVFMLKLKNANNFRTSSGSGFHVALGLYRSTIKAKLFFHVQRVLFQVVFFQRGNFH